MTTPEIRIMGMLLVLLLLLLLPSSEEIVVGLVADFRDFIFLESTYLCREAGKLTTVDAVKKAPGLVALLVATLSSSLLVRLWDFFFLEST